MFEVLESGWKDLVQKLQGAKTLVKVIPSLNEYLRNRVSWEKCCSRTTELKEVETNCHSNCELCFLPRSGFARCMIKSSVTVPRRFKRRLRKQRDAKTRSMHGEWGFDQFDEDVEGLNFYNLADEERLVEVESISEEFDISFRNLLSILNDRINGNSVQDVDTSSPSLMRYTPKQSRRIEQKHVRMTPYAF